MRKAFKEFSAEIRISRTMNNRGAKDEVHLEINDEDSRARILDAHMSLLQYADLITGHGSKIHGEILDDTDIVGMHKEVKTMNVFVPQELLKRKPERRTSTTTEERAALREWHREALAEFETEGWEGRGYDLENHHNRTHIMQGEGEVYKVAFFRHVDGDGAPYEDRIRRFLWAAYTEGIIDDAEHALLAEFARGIAE